jgi:hypothetical protein
LCAPESLRTGESRENSFLVRDAVRVAAHSANPEQTRFSRAQLSLHSDKSKENSFISRDGFRRSPGTD